MQSIYTTKADEALFGNIRKNIFTYKNSKRVSFQSTGFGAGFHYGDCCLKAGLQAIGKHVRKEHKMQRWEYCELGSGVLSKFTSDGDEPVSLKKSEYKNKSLAIYTLGREG